MRFTSCPGRQRPRSKSPADGDTYKYELAWSPDSKKIIWSDKKLRLRYVDVQTKNVTLVVQGQGLGNPAVRLVARQQWIAYAKPEVEGMQRVYLYSTAAKAKRSK